MLAKVSSNGILEYTVHSYLMPDQVHYWLEYAYQKMYYKDNIVLFPPFQDEPLLKDQAMSSRDHVRLLEHACLTADADAIDYWLECGMDPPDMTVLLRDATGVAFNRIVSQVSVSARYFAKNINYLSCVGSITQLEAFLSISPKACAIPSNVMVNVAMRDGDTRLQLLFNYGADISCADTARAAAQNCNLGVLQLQKKAGLDFQHLVCGNSKFRKALTYAGQDMIALFSQHICDLKPLMAELLNDTDPVRQLPTVYYLLEQGASLWDLTPRNRLRLILHQNEEFLDRLESVGVDLHGKASLLLREAATINNPILVSSLIDRGLDPHYRKGLSLNWALKHNAIHAAQTLVDHGVELLSRARELVELSAKHEQWASVRWLFDKGCHSDRIDYSKAPEDIQAIHKARMLQQRADQAKAAVPSPSQHRAPSSSL